MNAQEQANLETLYGEPGVTRDGYQVRNVNGDFLADLNERELRFVQGHECMSDCRRVGCEKVERLLEKARYSLLEGDRNMRTDSKLNKELYWLLRCFWFTRHDMEVKAKLRRIYEYAKRAAA